jgi:hypothetical protein
MQPGRTRAGKVAEANLEMLQAMLQAVLDGQSRIEAMLDRVIYELGDLKPRTTNTEDALAGVNRRLDRLDARMERIEQRYGVAED